MLGAVLRKKLFTKGEYNSIGNQQAGGTQAGGTQGHTTGPCHISCLSPSLEFFCQTSHQLTSLLHNLLGNFASAFTPPLLPFGPSIRLGPVHSDHPGDKT